MQSEGVRFEVLCCYLRVILSICGTTCDEVGIMVVDEAITHIGPIVSAISGRLLLLLAKHRQMRGLSEASAWNHIRPWQNLLLISMPWVCLMEIGMATSILNGLSKLLGYLAVPQGDLLLFVSMKNDSSVSGCCSVREERFIYSQKRFLIIYE